MWKSEDFGQTWTQEDDGPFPERSLLDAVVLDGNIVVVGGFTAADVKNDVWSTRVRPPTPPPVEPEEPEPFWTD